MGDNIILPEILVTELKIIEVIGGNVFHCMKKTDNGFNEFGEAYFTNVKSNQIKAWKMHNKMTLNLTVPRGKVKFVFVSPDNLNKFHVIEAGIDDYKRITVKPGVWFGFMGISDEESLILNIANIEHDSNEVFKKDVDDIKFNWKK
jgi:dTDP-4-dehydrorhamnose 3,5-epimerase